MERSDYILICEDNEFVLQVTSFALEAEGFNIETANNTDEIFQKLSSHNKPSLILLDLNIPEAGGEYVIRKLKTENETRDIPVVLFSGQENLEEVAAKLKVDGFLCKPFDNDDLKKIVNKFMVRA